MDVSLVRASTNRGISETWLQHHSLRVKLIDIGNQISQMKKWLHQFDTIPLILFVVDLDTYDELETSLRLFDSIVNSPWLMRSSAALFLNKTDILKQNLKTSPLEIYFTDYRDNTGGDDFKSAKKYIEQRFLEAYRAYRANRDMYMHVVQDRDVSNLYALFGIVSDQIMQQSLEEIGQI